MRRRIRLQTRLILWVTALLISVVGMMSFLFYGILVDAVEEQIGKRALSLSKTVAADPELREAFSREEPWKTIQPIAERARINSGAEFVVVGNEHGVRYSTRSRNESARRWSAGTMVPFSSGGILCFPGGRKPRVFAPGKNTGR